MTEPSSDVVKEFQRIGLLLESDPHLPSVVGIVAGGKVRGSWWGHPKGREIWRELRLLDDRGDVLVTRLVSGKVTFVHRRLWPDFLAIATSRETWQTRRLVGDARRLLRGVERAGTGRTDRAVSGSPLEGKVGDAARELERRLLVHGEEVHTGTGAHAKVLTSWPIWLESMKLNPARKETDAAKARFEALLDSLNRDSGGNGSLPWADRPEPGVG